MGLLPRSFRSSPLGELITGTAHETHPTDITAPLAARFAHKPLLALHIALEKAATVRVTFDGAGTPRLSGIRHIKQRSSPELAEVLRSEAAATRARWIVVVFATGWQAVLGQRAARPDAGEKSASFARHRLAFETPEVLVPRAQVDRVYTAVDHPVLDKSIVFSMRRRELEELFAEIRRTGLGIAAVRIAVAAQLEAWLAREGEPGLARDLLITDGLSALLVNTEQGDFVLPRSATEAEQPRQAVQRPSAVEDDVVRFITANDGRPMTFVGPEDLCAAAKKRVPGAELIRTPDHPAHESQLATLSAAVRHDLQFDAGEVRPAVPRRWRRWLVAYAAVLAVLTVTLGVNAAFALRAGLDAYRIERETDARSAEARTDSASAMQMTSDYAEANALRSWVAANFHAQSFCHELLRGIPATAAVEKLTIDAKDGQIALGFVIQGDQDTQLATRRSVERALMVLRYKIAGEEMPAAVPGNPRAVHYRMHLIAPDAGEVVRP